MKKIITLLSIGFALVSCVENIRENSASTDFELNAYFADNSTKSYMLDGEGVRDVSWSAGDEISLFFGDGSDGGAKLSTESDGLIASFKGDSDPRPEGASGTYYAIYPYDQSSSVSKGKLSTIIPSVQTALDNNFSDNTLVTVGKQSVSASDASANVGFYQVCGGIAFSVNETGISSVVFKSRNNELISGPVSISFNGDIPVASVTSGGSNSVELTCEQGFTPNVYYFIAMSPVVLTKGFSLSFYKGSALHTTTSVKSYIEIKRAVYGRITNANKQASLNGIVSGFDISGDGTSNCYIISEPGDYMFPAVKGNSSTPLGQPFSAKLIWETDNTSSPVPVNSLVSRVSCNSTSIFFTIPEGVEAGNALIAAVDSSNENNVLWSWHIWILPGYDPKSNAVKLVGSSALMLDRNLGALSPNAGNALSNGFFYQWGRKDPFMGAASKSADTIMASTAVQKSINSDATTGTVEYAIANPTTYINYTALSKDWLFSASNNKLWGASKTIYDPCPVGWKVPEGSEWQNTVYQIESVGVNFDTSSGNSSWYPANGYLKGPSYGLTMVGKYACYWTSTAASASVSGMDFSTEGNKYLNTLKGNKARSEGHSIRCISE